MFKVLPTEHMLEHHNEVFVLAWERPFDSIL